MKRYRGPIKALFNDVRNLTTEQIEDSKEFKQMLKTQIPIAIERAIKTKKEVATVFEINSSSSFVEITKSDWTNALEKCITWYGEEEDYTTCIRLKELVTKIKEPKK